MVVLALRSSSTILLQKNTMKYSTYANSFSWLTMRTKTTSTMIGGGINSVISKGKNNQISNLKRLFSNNSDSKSTSWWSSAQVWGTAGALAGWGMSGAAIYDATQSSPDVISLNMTGVLLVYSSLFARWAFVVKPQNLLLCACHVTNIFAQGNQIRRALQHKSDAGETEEVKATLYNAAGTVAVGLGCIALGPTVQSFLVSSNLGVASTIAAADAGPFTVHFWAPMSKWLISGASFLELDRPTDKISLAQYTALTLTGLFFSRYSLLVTPVNYTLCSVNVALFASSGWHLSRKIHADYIA